MYIWIYICTKNKDIIQYIHTVKRFNSEIHEEKTSETCIKICVLK